MASDSDTNSTYLTSLTSDSDAYSTVTTSTSTSSTTSDLQESLDPIDNDNNEDLLKLARYSMYPDEQRPYMAIIDLCRSGEKTMVEFLLKNFINLDKKSEYLKQALMISVKKRKVKIVELLLKHGVIVSDNYDACTPLLYSCSKGYNAIADLLIKYGCDNCARDHESKTALIISCELRNNEIIEALLQNTNDNIDAFDRYCMSALMYACKNRDLDTVKLLLQHGAQVDACNDYDETALIYISQFHNADKVAEVLLENGADVNRCTNKGITALISACECHASQCDRLVEVLLRYGADVNASDSDGKTALIHMVSEGQRLNEIIELLFHHKVNVDAIDNDGKTALMYACLNGYDGVVELLLQKSANCDFQCEEGSSAIMLAAFCEPDETDDVKCLKKLLDFGAYLDFTDKYGCSVFSNALQGNGDCLKVLLDSGKLVDSNGLLRTVHKNANNSDSSLQAILVSIEYKVFEWEWCCVDDFKSVAFAAMNAGFCPGNLVYNADHFVSPLILALIKNDKEAAKTFLTHLYYFPDDYKILTTPDHPLRTLITDFALLDEITLQPMSLLKWSFLSISKAVSLTGHHTQRPQRVESLPIPDILKKKLMFKLD